MKTDPTASISSATGTSLSYPAIESGNRTAKQAISKSKLRIAISDSVETGDRDADGRKFDELEAPGTNQDAQPVTPIGTPDSNGSRLDLTG